VQKIKINFGFQQQQQGFWPRILNFKNFSAIGLALFAGVFYGFTFTPVIYMQDNPLLFTPQPPKEALHYVFSHFTGIYLMSTLAFIIYIVGTRNQPFVNPRTILPSLISGTLFATGMFSWFPANDYLSQGIVGK
jgi:hypothetical protein